jgi:hypothetical protein
LAPQVTPAARSTFAPVAEAAIAWWHAYETRRRRRLLAALVAALILAAGLLRLQNPLGSTSSVRAPVSVAAALAAR